MWWWNVRGWWSFGMQLLAATITLAERFASGEIDEMEYRRRLRVLEETTGAESAEGSRQTSGV